MDYAEMANRLAGVEDYLYKQIGLPQDDTITRGKSKVNTHWNSLCQANRLTLTEYLDTFFPDLDGYPRAEVMIEFGKTPEISLLSKNPTESRSVTLDWGGGDTIDGRLRAEKTFSTFPDSVIITAHYDTDGEIKGAELCVEEAILGYTVPEGPIMVNPESPVLHYERSNDGRLVKVGFTPLEYPVNTGTLVLPDVIPISENTIQFIVEHVYARRHILEPARPIDLAKISGVIFPNLTRQRSLSIPSRLYYESIISFIERLAKKEQKLLPEIPLNTQTHSAI